MSFFVLYLAVVGGGVCGFSLVLGKGGPTLRVAGSGFLSAGQPEWGHLAKLGLGSGCAGPFRSSLVGFVRRLFPGSTKVLEGIV